MTPSLDQDLLQRLDQLEQRGRHYLRATQRQAAAHRALAWALPVTVVVPALWLLAQAWLRGHWPALALMAVLVPLVAGGLVYAVTRSRQRVGRVEALDVLDQQLGLKDRLTASAALLAQPRRDGFAQAALLEAAPWIDRALARPLAMPAGGLKGPGANALRRRWLFLPVALLLVLAAGWMQWRTGVSVPPVDTVALVAGTGTDGRTAPSPAATVAAAQAVQASQRQKPEASVGAGTVAKTGAEASASTAMSTAAPGGAAAPATPALATPSPATDARPSQAAPSTTAGAQAEAAQPSVGTSRQSAREADPPPPSPAQRSEAAGPGAGQDDADEQASSADARPRGQQEAPSQRGSQPPPPDKPSQSSKDGQPQNNGRSKGGNDSQNDGKGSGDGPNNGARRGQDAGTKAGRGFATLMLARPMRDQVLGQTSAGRISSTLQQGRPQGGPATTAQAQDRGTLADNAAVLPARPQTAQDRALLREYFDRGDGREASASPSPAAGATPSTPAPAAGNDPKATR